MRHTREFMLTGVTGLEFAHAGYSFYKAVETGENLTPVLPLLTSYGTDPIGHFMRAIDPPQFRSADDQFYTELGTEALVLGLIMGALAATLCKSNTSRG